MNLTVLMVVLGVFCLMALVTYRMATADPQSVEGSTHQIVMDRIDVDLSNMVAREEVPVVETVPDVAPAIPSGRVKYLTSDGRALSAVVVGTRVRRDETQYALRRCGHRNAPVFWRNASQIQIAA